MCALLLFSEEEAKWLRLYIDEPAYTDLHWVLAISLRKHISQINGCFLASMVGLFDVVGNVHTGY